MRNVETSKRRNAETPTETSKSQNAETGLSTSFILHPFVRVDAAAAVAVFVLALVVRWPLIERGETLLHSDEAIVGLMAQDIAEGERFPIYFYGQRYMGALEAYVVAAATPLFDDPITALRFGPACFFALFVAVQTLMLTRWFGRRGGLLGAAVLLAAAPMFAQWSISARGGYVEVLLWGSALLWAYSEWFVETPKRRNAETPKHQKVEWGVGIPKSAFRNPHWAMAATRRRIHRFVLGLLMGSGMWINPSILLFVLPIVVHALLNRPLAAVLAWPGAGRRLQSFAGRMGLATLPVLLLLALLALNVTWSVWVDEGGEVRKQLLLGVLPQPVAVALLLVAAAAVFTLGATRTKVKAVEHARCWLRENGLLILGMLAGAAPALLYVLGTLAGLHPMEPSLPLGLRPIWLAGDTMSYLLHGLPLLFGADPRPFLQLVSVGRDTAVKPLDMVASGFVSGANWLAWGAIASSCMVFLASRWESVSRLLRLRPANHPPAILLLIGLLGMIGLYIMGGCALDFTTIRYLIPVWVFVPGLMAAVFVSRRFALAARLAPVCVCVAWATGQWAMHQQLGNPHPLRSLATTLVARRIDPAIAEPLDAHLLSYLTRQQCRVAEFESFWPRLAHYRPVVEREGPTDYIVQTSRVDRTWDWIDGGWPGEPPPETKRFLWPRLRRVLLNDPARVLSREPLADGYERIRLSRPLRERNASG